MQICTAITISIPDGQMIESKREIIHLGNIIACDGKCEREVSRRIGEGRSVFKLLSKLWCHANLTVHRKVQIFNACVVSKVLYALESLWLLKSVRNRLDAFQCYCLRQIMRIPPSYISRISNVSVLGRSSQVPLSELFKERQIRCYKRVMAASQSDFVKQLVCDSVGKPFKWYVRRSRGRPRQRWVDEVFHLINLSDAESNVPFR